MKSLVCVSLAIAALVVLSAPALGDWNVGDPYKWLQLPDLSTAPSTGVDVDCTDHPGGGPHRIVADDFLCTSTGPITDIHIWGSWRGDYLPSGTNPNAVSFRLSIMADVPAGTGNYSHPDGILWQYTFAPGTYTSRVYAGGPELMDEWFYDPVSGQVNWPGDHTVWQYNFTHIPTPFFQQGTAMNPIVYWLGVDAVVADPQAEFGWKTSVQHWNDDATWQNLPNPGWGELRYFQEHPLQGQSMDMAFVLTVPEPSMLILLLSGGTALLLCGWRRWRRS
jgi:hypothetical protein